MKRYSYLIIAQIFLIVSCSLIIKWDTNTSKNYLLPQKKPQTICTNDSIKGDQLLIKTPEINEAYQYIIKKLNNKKLLFIEKAVLLSLIQINFRPDIASPTSNYYILIKEKKQKFLGYLAIRPNILKRSSWPYMEALHQLLKLYNSKYTLESFAFWLDKWPLTNIKINDKFSIYLKKNSAILQKNPIFKKTYFKAEQPLGQGESLPKISYRNLIKTFRKKRTPTLHHNHLFDYNIENTKNSQTNIKCNYDFNLYKNATYLIAKKEHLNNPLGISDQFGNSFLGVSTQSQNNPTPIEDTFLIKDTSYQDSLSLCFINNKLHQSQISIISTKGRDPGQFLYQLILYEIYNTSSVKELDTFIKFPRHLFLLNPVRMIYESDRGSTKQLSRFLTMKFPIYYTEVLGNIWAHATYNDKNSLIFDNRHSGKLNCPNNLD